MDHRTDGELQAYLDAELLRNEAAVVAEHLVVCTDCRVRLGELRMAGESFRQAVGELDKQLSHESPATPMPLHQRRARAAGARHAVLGRSALMRAAVLLLVVAGAATAVVPGFPLRQLIDRLVSDRAIPERVEVPALPVEQAEEFPSPGIASVTVAPVDGNVAVSVRRFADGSTVRVRFGSGPDMRARLLSGSTGARFSVGPGSLFVVGTGSSAVGEILIELPRGLNSATVSVDGKRSLVASPDGLRRSGDPGGVPEDEVVLRVGG